jgi:NAD(P) transhydrogenase subunit alpha
MKLGIPKEVLADERRVAVTPTTLRRFKKQGFDVLIEPGAGLNAGYSDEEYLADGAQLVEKPQLFAQADLILKVAPPTEEEIPLYRSGQVHISYMYPAEQQTILTQLAEKKVSTIAMDAIPRISRAQKMDVLSSMANIAGYRAVIEGANHFGRFLNGQITAAGRVDPARVLVIGAGVAGLAAIGTAKNLGAIVYAFDTRKDVEEQV